MIRRSLLPLGILTFGVGLVVLAALLLYMHVAPWLFFLEEGQRACCLHNLTHHAVATRLLCAFIASVFFGLLRQMSSKPVGFASYVIVSLGACCLGLVVTEIKVDKLEVNLLSAGITGIGFLGSGAFIKQKTTGKIHGFTNGACIWIFAVMGITLGLGEYDLFCLTYVMLLGTVLIDAYFERHSMGSYQKRVEIVTSKIVPMAHVEAALSSVVLHHKLVSISIDRGVNKMKFVFLIEAIDPAHRLPEFLSAQSWFESGGVGG